MISQGKCISYLVALLEASPSNCTKGDMKNCLSRCNEPDHIFKIVLSVSSVENNCICTP